MNSNRKQFATLGGKLNVTGNNINYYRVQKGLSAHALGTSKALEMGEVEGAMSSLSIGISGVMTVIIVPLLVNFIK